MVDILLFARCDFRTQRHLIDEAFETASDPVACGWVIDAQLRDWIDAGGRGRVETQRKYAEWHRVRHERRRARRARISSLAQQQPALAHVLLRIDSDDLFVGSSFARIGGAA